MIIFNFEFIKGLPEEHGTYLFVLEDSSIREGYYSSFSFPNHGNDVRIADDEYERFYYCNIIGYLKPLL